MFKQVNKKDKTKKLSRNVRILIVAKAKQF